MKILIDGLDREGPGDVLGAIAGETDVDPGVIGNIDIGNGKALVEVDEGVAEDLVEGGLDPYEIAVISPYNDQVDLLRRKISDVEVKTVDGFQGREKEAVIISLTRSNPEGEIGFLKDVRRLNVALTRAKRKLIIVGDASTVSSHPAYEELVKYVEEEGFLTAISE